MVISLWAFSVCLRHHFTLLWEQFLYGDCSLPIIVLLNEWQALIKFTSRTARILLGEIFFVNVLKKNNLFFHIAVFSTEIIRGAYVIWIVNISKSLDLLIAVSHLSFSDRFSHVAYFRNIFIKKTRGQKEGI